MLNGKCVLDCAPQTVRRCAADGNLYWYDSCGAQGELTQNCGNDELTSNYRCSGNRVQRQILKRGCLTDACFTAPEWQDAFNCSDSEICRDGNCVASEANPAPLPPDNEGITKIFSVTYEKYRVWIVAKIEGMRLRFVEIARQFFDRF